MTILEAKNVSYVYQGRYQRVKALDQVSCQFEAGRLYAIIGQSGSGKTTLLSLLAGLGTPTEGTILVQGKELTAADGPRHRRETVSVIYQAFHLLPSLTVLENVMYPLQICGEPAKAAQQRALELLEQVGLKHEQAKKFPSMLSGGEQQRVAIARALAAKGKIILADEPTGNLDSTNGARVLGILRNLVDRENYCVVIITHDLTIAEQADVVYKLKDGRLEGMCLKEAGNEK